MMEYIERSARLSNCKNYRYVLGRRWELNKPKLLYVMLNPSTADAFKDDPTIRSCARLARLNGYGSLEVVNLFAWRATKPKELYNCVAPVGPDNDNQIRLALDRCDDVACAWGAHALAQTRGQKVLQIINVRFGNALCFGKTAHGSPRHPLYVGNRAQLEYWP